MNKVSRSFESFIVSKKDTMKKQMELQWASYQDEALKQDLDKFWDSNIPDLDIDPGIEIGCTAVRVRQSGIVMPWKAYYRWLRELSDKQFHTITEALYEEAEKCYFAALPEKLCTLNEIQHWFLWLPQDLKARIEDHINFVVEHLWKRFKVNNDVTFEDITYLYTYCNIYGVSEECAHPLMLVSSPVYYPKVKESFEDDKSETCQLL